MRPLVRSEDRGRVSKILMEAYFDKSGFRRCKAGDTLATQSASSLCAQSRIMRISVWD